MHIHILGIGGTFMGGVALLAKAKGYHVTGSDCQLYPPMSDQLRAYHVEVYEGYDLDQLKPIPDKIIIGNVLRRGNPIVEYILRQGLPYQSGAQWLAEHILKDHWVLGVAGTHGKTTTSSLLAWILADAKLDPGFLIGGIPMNFGSSARLGGGAFFIVEADEYDTAFFDKRSKFVHYHPRTLILNNLEFDHADIFPNLKAIQTQFHHLIRTVPDNGLIVHPLEDVNLAYTLAQGCWTPCETFSTMDKRGHWNIIDSTPAGDSFTVLLNNLSQGRVNWPLLGVHNQMNALAAIAAARHVGVPPAISIQALNTFKGVKRRLEVIGEANGITIYFDFAHHPTAIATTLQGLRQKVGEERIFAILEMGSYTMSHGVHGHRVLEALQVADFIFILNPTENPISSELPFHTMSSNVNIIIERVLAIVEPQDHLLIMSNKNFHGLPTQLLQALST